MNNMNTEDTQKAIHIGSEMSHILKLIYLDETSIWYKSPAIDHLLRQFFDAIGCAEC